MRSKVLESWSMKLKRSGYPASTRHQVVRAAVERWEQMCQVEDAGGRLIHRAREWQKAARRLEKEKKVVTWHQGRENQISAPLIIDPTAGDLTKRMKKTCSQFKEESEMRVAVRERAGRKMKADCKPEPLKQLNCGRETCLCCRSGNPGRCEQNSSGYRISCDTCQLDGSQALYDGETGRNAYARGMEHQDGLKNENENNPLWKHCTLVHGGAKQDFSMEVVGCFKSCLERQVNEAVRITSSKAKHILNSKSEFHQAPLPPEWGPGGGPGGGEEGGGAGRGRVGGARGRGRRGGAPG